MENINCIAILFSDDMEKCDVQMSEYVWDILRLYPDEEIVFTQYKHGVTTKITIETIREEVQSASVNQEK